MRTYGLSLLGICLLWPGAAQTQEPVGQGRWTPSEGALRPFWQGEIMDGESVLFIYDAERGESSAQVLFPVLKVLAVKSSSGEVTYEQGRDFHWQADSRRLTLPSGSRIPFRTRDQLRRPAKSQRYELTHRDGNGEIFFGAELEYAQMQVCITYRHAPGLWQGNVPKLDRQALPHCLGRLSDGQGLTIVALGDSITAGANASGNFNRAPFQPAYPELVRRGLAEHYGVDVRLSNLAVGGTDTAWGITQVDTVVAAKPQLVVLAFGMNDAANRAAAEYQSNIKKIIEAIRLQLPKCEFILVASMLGNRDWTRLKHEVFPQYRDALEQLCEPGIVLADLTSTWCRFLELKPDWDLTGNGVNHPNDFGHRVYAQTILSHFR